MSDSTQIDQSKRLLKLDGPVPGMVPRQLTVREAISRPFLIEVEFFASKGDIAQSDLVGKPITITVQHNDDTGMQPRPFHGIVRSLSRLGDFERGFTGYRIEAVPRAWMMSRAKDCRVFSSKTVKQIVEELVGEHNVGPATYGTLPSEPRPYCTQYMETDLDFIQRILDECGGAYWFEHSSGNHTFKVVGDKADFPTIPGDPLEVSAIAGGTSHDRLSGWSAVGSMIPSKVTSIDYDQLKPGQLSKQTTTTKVATAQAANWEMFLWSGGQDVLPGVDISKLVIETAEAMHETYTAVARNPVVHAGGKLSVKMGTGGPTKSCIVQVVTHTAYDDTSLVGGGTADYQAEIRLQSADYQYRNPTPRPRPVMSGLYPAKVVGPGSDEIHTDEYGRIKVWFPWDAGNAPDDTKSCWVRVLQPFAGAWGGSWFLPRVGDEVIIGYMQGNPDYPVCVGSVYNYDAKPPFTLTANKTQSGFKTRSSTKGGPDNANILRFDDKKDSEEIYVQAEKDMNIKVKNDRDTKILGKHTEVVTKDRTETVEQGNYKLTLDKGNMDTKVSMGNLSVKVDLGKIEVEAMQSIELKVGQSSIKIDQMGVTINGAMLKFKGTGMAEMSAPMTTVKGDGMLTLKGGVMMIN